jgi:hypothetical protein
LRRERLEGAVVPAGSWIGRFILAGAIAKIGM